MEENNCRPKNQSKHFLSSDTYFKMIFCLRSFLSVLKERLNETLVFIPYESNTTDDVENHFNLMRFYAGNNYSPDIVQYQQRSPIILLRRLNKHGVSNNGSSYEYLDRVDGQLFLDPKFIKELKSSEKNNTTILNTNSNFSFVKEVNKNMYGIWVPNTLEKFVLEKLVSLFGKLMKSIKNNRNQNFLTLLNK